MNSDQNIKVVIVDYGMGNLFSVKNACEHAGITPTIATTPNEILEADGVILPGVGAFGGAMVNLRKLSLDKALFSYCMKSDKPFLGICLGFQLLMEESNEFGYNTGLGIFKGTVARLDGKGNDNTLIKVPQVGWNQIQEPEGKTSQIPWQGSLLDGIQNRAFMYFVHSYYVLPSDQNVILSTTQYGDVNFCSSIQRGLIFGCQFHPERSASDGIQIYRNFAKLIKKTI